MASKLGPALNQKKYPGAGDVDDCWVVATIQAANPFRPGHEPGKPSITTFRQLAGVPDKPGDTGGTRIDVYRGAHACWEKDPNFTIPYAPENFEDMLVILKTGATLSVAVRSSLLPTSMQYGFKGLHQLAVDWADGKLWIVNPLQPEGSAPTTISAAALKAACYGFYNDNKLWGVMFVPTPKPVPVPPSPTDPKDKEIANLKVQLAAAEHLATTTKAQFDAYIAAEQESDKKIREAIIAEADKLLL